MNNKNALDAEKVKAETNLLSLEAEKVKTEQLKIKKEIDLTQRPLYKKAEFYASIAPALLGIIGLFFTYQSGYFDVRRGEIQNKVDLLAIREVKLNMKIDALVEDSIKLQKRYDDMTMSLEQEYVRKEQHLQAKNEEIQVLYSEEIKEKELKFIELKIQIENSKNNKDEKILALEKLIKGYEASIEKANKIVASRTALIAKKDQEIDFISMELQRKARSLKKIEEEQKTELAKNEILIILLFEKWDLASYSRINSKLDNKYSNEFLDVVINNYPNIFQRTDIIRGGRVGVKLKKENKSLENFLGR